MGSSTELAKSPRRVDFICLNVDSKGVCASQAILVRGIEFSRAASRFSSLCRQPLLCVGS